MVRNLDARTRDSFALALGSLLGSREVEPAEFASALGIRTDELTSLLDGAAEPTDPVVFAAARALGVQPSYFLEYRLRTLIQALERRPAELDQVFARALTPGELAAAASDDTTRAPLPSAVATLLREQQSTHRELADEVGSTPSQLSRTLREPSPSLEVLETLALALGVEPHYFREFRLAVVKSWLHEDLSEVDRLFDALGDPLRLAPYSAWTLPRRQSLDSLDARALVAMLREIIGAEGPVTVPRVRRLVFDATGSSMSRQRRSRINRGVYALVHAGWVAARNEGEENDGLSATVVRLRSVPAVVPRTRGPRRLPEVPLSELAEVATAAMAVRRLSAVADIQRALADLYDVRSATTQDVEHVNRAINRAFSEKEAT